MPNTTEELNLFLRTARSEKVNYYSCFSERPLLPNHKEFTWKDGPWNYSDSFSGVTQCWGREIVFLATIPYWILQYGPAKIVGEQSDCQLPFAINSLLKRVISLSQKKKRFIPRGPETFAYNGFTYKCKWTGNIKLFYGSEEVFKDDQVVFRMDFNGGKFKF